MNEGTTVLRPISFAIAGAILVATVVALVTVLSGGGVSDNDFKVGSIGIAFLIFSAAAAAGVRGLWRDQVPVQLLGLATLVLSTIAFGLAIAVTLDDNDEGLAKWAAAILLVTLALAHVTLTTAAMSRRDPLLQRVPDLLSMLFAVAAALLGLLLITESIDDTDQAAKFFVADLILVLAATDIAALLRRGRRG